MSSHALEPTTSPLSAVRYLDCVLVVAALPFVLLADLPVLGYTAGAGAWLAQRGLSTLIERKAKASGDVRAYTGLMLASTFGRAWVVSLTILAVGVGGDREDGLMAAVLIAGAFTVYFAIALILRPLERKPSTP